MRRRPVAASLPRFVRARMHRRIFFWFGATILLTAICVGGVSRLVGGESQWHREVERARAFVGHSVERVWDDPAERTRLLRGASADLDVDLSVYDARGALLESTGGRCKHPMVAPVVRAGAKLGEVHVCTSRHNHGLRLALPLALAIGILWAASGALARRLTRPLDDVARVAALLGRGQLSTRVELGRAHHGEVRVLGQVLNDMAARVEKQLADQRALLAAVSHEIRTPLARLRLLVEMARSSATPAKQLDQIDREVEEVDALVSDLLASSRLDFSAMTPKRLDAVELARTALERAEVDRGALVLEGVAEGGLWVEGDATLLARAVANLVENAKRHAGGVARLRIAARGRHVGFEVEDDGPGFARGDESRVFEPFYRGQEPRTGAGGVGLGLSLVRRIAEAHGGRAYAANRPEGGALVAMELPVG